MQRLKFRTYKLLIILLIVFIFFTIAMMQSYYNLKNILINPSENWGRNITLKEQIPNKKAAAINLTEEISDVLIVNGTEFENISITRKNGQLNRKVILIENAQPDKVSKMDWCKEYVVWMENFDLYYSSMDSAGNYKEKQLIFKDVKDFQLSKANNNYDLVVAKSSSISIYKLSNGTAQQIGTDYSMEHLRGVDCVKDNSGVLHIAAYSSENDIIYPIKYLTFNNDNWKLVSEKSAKYLSRAWKVSSIDIGIDNSDAYIFYQLRKWDSYGVSSNVYVSIVPLNVNDVNMEFELLSIFDEEKNSSTSFISDVNCAKEQADILKLALIKDSIDIKMNEGFTIYLLNLDNGRIINREQALQQKTWLSSLYLTTYKDEIAISVLDTAGKGLSEVLYTDSNKEFIEAVAKPTKRDLLYAFLNIIPGYVIGVFLGLIRSLIFIPSIAWLLFVEFFDIKKFKKRPILTNRIALIIYIVIKLFTIKGYYTPISTELMPNIMKFAGAPYIYAVLTVLVAILIAKLYKKSKPDMHNMTEFFTFIFFDIIFTTFLYTTYLA